MNYNKLIKAVFKTYLDAYKSNIEFGFFGLKVEKLRIVWAYLVASVVDVIDFMIYVKFLQRTWTIQSQ